jgi:hypothetical protein
MKLKKFDEYSLVNEEVDELGVVNIHIDGEGWIKKTTINEIQKAMRNLQGERHIFVDGKEI